MVGSAPDPVPPQIQIGVDGSAFWDRPGAFGPVPAELQQDGDGICGAGMKAVGYHPEAKDQQGDSFEGGGFLCAPR